MEKNKFLGMLYDILISEDIIKYEDKPKDLKEKKERLEKYLDKLERVQDKSIGNDRYLDRIKKLYYDRYIIKESDIPDNYLRSLEQQYLDQGHGHINLVNPQNRNDETLRNEHIKTVIREQKDSLDNWLNYLLSEDSSYLEMWAKVWAFQGMLHIGNINKNRDGYDRRSKTTVNPFVSFDSEILGKCVELIKETFDKKDLTDEEVKKLISTGSFTKLYGKLLANKKQIKVETTEGIWIKYNRETEDSIKEKLNKGQVPEHIKLYDSLQGYNTGWCTAGARDTAKTQILGGDFYVYYSRDLEDNFTIPRLAIRMQGNSIGEIRGIASNQNIESNMEEILEEKLKEFPDRDSYKKKVSDMKNLTTIYNKYLKCEQLSKEDLMFIYEIYNKIDGFGYEKDPRINEIINTRNKRKDFSYALDCSEDEISFIEDEYYADDYYNDYHCKDMRLKYYEGDFELEFYDCVDIMMLPEFIDGDLIFSDVDSIELLIFPKIINGDLKLSEVVSAKNVLLPSTVEGYLDLSGLTSAEGLILPQTLNCRWLNLEKLTSAEGLVFPKIINGSLVLRGLLSVQGLVLPKTINGGLYLNRLTSAEGLILPQTLSGYLDLSGLTSAKGLVLPKTINGDLDLSGLMSAEGLILPKTINGSLYLSGLMSTEGLELPQTINENLSLASLSHLIGITLPQNVAGSILIYGKKYTLEQVIEMQKREEEQLKNNKPKGLSRVKQEGFISNTIIVLNIILFGVLSFILTLLIIK